MHRTKNFLELTSETSIQLSLDSVNDRRLLKLLKVSVPTKCLGNAKPIETEEFVIVSMPTPIAEIVFLYTGALFEFEALSPLSVAGLLPCVAPFGYVYPSNPQGASIRFSFRLSKCFDNNDFIQYLIDLGLKKL